jgi:hypothetical protein
MMRKNMGKADRYLRIVAAAVVLVLYFTGNIGGVLATILLSVAAIFIATSLINFCPIYRLFGMSTCKVS